jgi:hypothetical protein
MPTPQPATTATFPVNINLAGYVPQTPAALRASLVNAVGAVNPGFTSDLPGSLVEDIVSTDVYALAQMDSSIAEFINSLTPAKANAYLLNLLGVQFGLTPGTGTNSSVFLTVSGPPGFVIVKGFTVSDGTHQYQVLDGGIIGAGGQSPQLYAVALLAGQWAIPPNTVNQIITSVPSPIVLSITNPQAGVPSSTTETEEAFRSRVLQAMLASSQGMGRYLRTLLENIQGVQPRLIAIKQIQNQGLWEIICGGGDVYQVAYAIYQALFDINNLSGSVNYIDNITNTSPAVFTTTLNHGYVTGQVVTINGAPQYPSINLVPLTATVLSPTMFSLPVSLITSPVYAGTSAFVTPNFRNILASITDYPDTYVIPFVNPPQQTVAVSLIWNTNSPNYVNPAVVAQLGQAALYSYINSINVGVPINVYEMQLVFTNSIGGILPAQLVTRMQFAVSIDGIGVLPTPGTGIIAGDPESYFQVQLADITIGQG